MVCHSKMANAVCLVKKLLAEKSGTWDMPALEEIGKFWKSSTFDVRLGDSIPSPVLAYSFS